MSTFVEDFVVDFRAVFLQRLFFSWLAGWGMQRPHSSTFGSVGLFLRVFTFVDRSSKFGFSIASAKLLLVSLIFVTAFDFVVVLFPLRAAFFDGEVPGFVLGALYLYQAESCCWLMCWDWQPEHGQRLMCPRLRFF